MKETELKELRHELESLLHLYKGDKWSRAHTEDVMDIFDRATRSRPSDEPCVHQWRASHDYTLLYCVKCGKEHKSVEQDDKHLCADKPSPTTSEVDKTEQIATIKVKTGSSASIEFIKPSLPSVGVNWPDPKEHDKENCYGYRVNNPYLHCTCGATAANEMRAAFMSEIAKLSHLTCPKCDGGEIKPEDLTAEEIDNVIQKHAEQFGYAKLPTSCGKEELDEEAVLEFERKLYEEWILNDKVMKHPYPVYLIKLICKRFARKRVSQQEIENVITRIRNNYDRTVQSVPELAKAIVAHIEDGK